MFEPNLELYQAARSSSGRTVVRLNDRTLIVASGNDRAKHLHNFCTADVMALKPGEGTEAFILNAKGRTIGFVNLLCLEDEIWIDSAAGQFETLHNHLDRYIIREDVVLTDRSVQSGCLLLGGPEIQRLASELIGDSLPGTVLHHQQCSLAGVEFTACRVDWVTGDAYLLFCPLENQAALLGTCSEFGFVELDRATYEVLRMEAGTPIFGADITAENLPQEVNRTKRAISFHKGCYLGQETVARIDALGHVNRHLCSVAFPQPENSDEQFDGVRIGTELTADGKPAGKITSVCRSPKNSGLLALAYVKTAFAKSGAALKAGNVNGVVKE